MMLLWFLYGLAWIWWCSLGHWYWFGFLVIFGMLVIQKPIILDKEMRYGRTRIPALLLMGWWLHGGVLAHRGWRYWAIFGALSVIWMLGEHFGSIRDLR